MKGHHQTGDYWDASGVKPVFGTMHGELYIKKLKEFRGILPFFKMRNYTDNMKQRPILFSTEMVRAILDGRKTQTRRVLKNQKIRVHPIEGWPASSTGEVKCPYGQVGDVLWVREMLYQDGELGLKYVADNEWIDNESIPDNHNAYRNYAHCNIPSIHMPKWAARIFLEITGIRVERLNEISEEDAIAEGIVKDCDYGTTGYRNYLKPDEVVSDICAVESYQTLWESINGPGSWSANPWVWVVTFKRIEKP